MKENIYEKVIAAALLKFGKLDNMDIHIICKNIISELDNEKYYCMRNMYQNLCKFIKINSRASLGDDNICLREEFTFDSIIDKDYLLSKKIQMNQTIDEYYYDGITLRELLERFSNEDVIKEYFDNLDIEKYYAEKEELLKKHKEELLNNANILLITDDESEYNKIKNYGFKKIDWFKSQVVADNYFKDHQDELNKYHIYIRGSHPYCRFDLYLYEKELEKKENTIKCSYFTCKKENQTCYEENFQDELTHNSWEAHSTDYNDILDSITIESLMKDVLNKVDKKHLSASLITIEEGEKKPVPKKIEDLNIQYLNYYKVPEFKDEVSKKLNLDVTFNPDNNDGIENHIFKNLGDYDIIIASNTYSGGILRLAKEAEEQLKCTGRKMALFVTYDEESNWSIDETGEYRYENWSEEIVLNYIFAGPGMLNKEKEQKKFNLVKDEGSDKKRIKAILEVAIEIYNEKLKEISETTFEKTGYKTSEEYEEEYQKNKARRDQRIKGLLEPIKNFNKMTSTINNYLGYKSWLEEDDKTFNIIKREDGMITVEQIEDDKVAARITYINKGQKDTYAEFIFSYEDENHSIKDKKRYGFYTSKHSNDLFLPKNPDEITAAKIKEFEEKIEEVLEPLCNEAFDKYWENERYIEKQQEKIEEFDRLYKILLYYFKYTSKVLGNIPFGGFQMSKNNEGIKVALMLGSRCVGAVTFERSYGDDSRVFLVEEINEKGVLSKPQRVGYSMDGKLKEPDEKQLLIINKVRDITTEQIVTLNNQVEIEDFENLKNGISFKMLYDKKRPKW